MLLNRNTVLQIMPNKIDTLRGYQNKIVDLSRRNRLLKYPKSARAINFDLTSTEFQEKFGILEELRIDFLHRAILKAEKNDEMLFSDEDGLDNEYIPPTNPKGQKLITLLNTLRLDTRRKFEEHGLHSLFLTFGKIRWKEPLAGRGSSSAVSEYDYNAPVLLVPIQVSEIKRPKTTIVTTSLDEQDITSNKVLSLLFESEYNARPINLNESYLNNLNRLMSNLISQAKSIFEELNVPYEISEEIQIGQYSFHGQQIYEDLHRNEQAIVKHTFVDALCGRTPIRQQNLKVATENPDFLLTPENDFNILDADVSQLMVIQKGLQGNHLTIQGPPGTGKSQTIVNLISNLLARQKTVLLVCEKQVALEVVLTRLQKVGLDKLCLPLFYYNADKKEFAKTVIKDRDYIANLAPDQQGVDVVLASRQKKIEKLRNYAQAIGEVVNPLGKTVQWVHGELARVQVLNGDALLPWAGPDPLSITFEGYQKLLAIMDNLAPIFDLPSREEFAHWRTIKRTHFSPDFVGRVNQTLSRIRTIIEEYRQYKPQPIITASIAQVRWYLSLTQLLSTIRPLDESVNKQEDIFVLSEILNSALAALEDYLRTANSFTKHIGIPLSWDRALLKSFDGSLKGSSTIAAIQDVKTRLQTVAERLVFVDQECSETVVKEIILNTSIDELISVKEVLLIDPVIKHLQVWNRAAALQPAFDQLKSLKTILFQIDKVKKVLTQWAIVPEELDSDSVKTIALRFEENYKPFYRFLYPSYRKDCRAIREWCSTGTPQSHQEYEEIALSLKEWFKLNIRFDQLLKTFSRDNVRPSVTIERRIVLPLYSSVKFLIEWLDLQGKQEIPEAYLTLVEGNDGSPSLKNILNTLEVIQDAFRPSKAVFDLPELDRPISVSFLSEIMPSLQSHIDQALNLYQQVNPLMDLEVLPKSVSELLQDAENISRLAAKLKSIQSLRLESVLAGNDIACQMINFPDDFKALVSNIGTVKRVFDLLLRNNKKSMATGRAFEIIRAIQITVPIWQRFIEQYNKQVEEFNRLLENDSSLNHLESISFDRFLEQLNLMSTDRKGLEAWILYRRYTSQLEDFGHTWFLSETKDKQGIQPKPLFAQSLWGAWLDAHYKNSPVLQHFNKNEHDKLIGEFRRLENNVLKVNAARIFKSVAPAIKQAKIYGRRQDAELVHQSQLQKRHKPIRRLVQTCGSQLQQYKPCWMMSPLTLSSYIPFGTLEFDVVIFDEASQMRVEHSLGAISRAKQVLILGDENQLPPTSFFEVISESADEEEAADLDYESILHAAKAILPGADELLSYHYRSKYEDLIAFSNHYVYKDQLITFPNPYNQHRAVVFEYVEDGVYDSGGTRRNDIEAKRVIELCADYAAEHPSKSLGVIAFSKAQEQAIRDAKVSFISRNPHLDTRLDEESEEPDSFFIKNLETVQGDERDIIFLSIGYGRDKNGNVHNRFGPINTQYGHRRLNVAVTRAKEKVVCVSSIKASDIRPSERKGVQHLQKYLEYAKQGIKVLEASLLIQSQLGIEPDSPFELEVENALNRLGYTVHRQVGASGYKIDLVVVNPSNNQEYVLGIECDGASYHSSYSARVNDRIRQEILERLGWKIYRIWSQHWISSREEIINDIVRVISDNSIPNARSSQIESNLLM